MTLRAKTDNSVQSLCFPRS